MLAAKDFICLFDAFHQVIKKFAHENLHHLIAFFYRSQVVPESDSLTQLQAGAFQLSIFCWATCSRSQPSLVRR